MSLEQAVGAGSELNGDDLVLSLYHSDRDLSFEDDVFEVEWRIADVVGQVGQEIVDTFDCDSRFRP